MIKINEICKKYDEKVLFQNYSLEIPDGSFVIIRGDSGSGKSTLLNMIGGIEYPDSGSIIVNGFDVSKKKKQKYFSEVVGFLFQNFALLENKTVLENLKLSKEELSSFIIGSLNKFNPPLTNMQKGQVALTMYLSGKTTEDLNRDLKEALETKVEDFEKVADLIERAMKEDYTATIGNNEKIKEDCEVFKEIRPLNK